MSSIVPHVFPETGQPVRTVVLGGEPWFVARDVCDVLDISNSRMAVARLDADGVSTADVIDSMGRTQQASVVSEPGLYELVFLSRKPEARAFRRWITHEVIPAIRKTGRYEVAPRALSNRELALMVIAESDRADAEARRAIEAESRVAELEPVAQAYDVIASAKGDFSLRDAAFVLNRDPGIDTGQNRLMESLRKLQMIDRRGVPYAKHSAHLTERVRAYPHPATGEPTLAKRPQIRITVAGLRYLHRQLGGVAPLRFDQLPMDPAA